jgi:hypothetical protein
MGKGLVPSRHHANSAAITVDLADLGKLGAQLGRGGEATVHEAPSAHLPDVSGPLVYKKYKTPPSRQDELRRIVQLRAGLSAVERDYLDARTTWPLRLVESGGVVTGILMRRIPEQFGDRITSAATGSLEWSLREVSFLFIDPARLGGPKVGRQVPGWDQRLTICRDFAELLDFYHRRLQVVFGDINARNELYRLDGPPSVMFIDCDGVRTIGSVHTGQLNAPDWEPPGGRATPLGLFTDRYKLGLFVLRALTPGPQTSTRTDPQGAAAVLDAAGLDLLTRALDPSPCAQDRPAAEEWWRYFSLLLGDPVDPPVLTSVRLARDYVLAGEPAALHWAADNALTVDVTVNGRTTTFDATAGHGVARVDVDHSTARIDVVATNRLGEDATSVGPLAVIPPPQVQPLPLLVPDLPRLDDPGFEVPAPALPRVPELVLPSVPGPAGPRAVEQRFDWPGTDVAPFPFDLTDLLLGGPDPLAGLLHDPEGKT